LPALEKHPEIRGGHGWERLLPCSGLSTREPSPRERRMRDEALELAEDPVRKGAGVEGKSASIPLHWQVKGSKS